MQDSPFLQDRSRSQQGNAMYLTLRRRIISCLASCSNTSNIFLSTASGSISQHHVGGLSIAMSTGTNASQPFMLGTGLKMERQGVLSTWLPQQVGNHLSTGIGFTAIRSLACVRTGFERIHGDPQSYYKASEPALLALQRLRGSLLTQKAVRCITTKTWRRLKMKKHKVRKRRRLNRKAAK